jgi:hypothetical protein
MAIWRGSSPGDGWCGAPDEHCPRDTSLPDIASSTEAKERLIRRAASLFGVEPYAGSLLLAIDRDHIGIQVEDHGGKGVGFHEELASESVVERLKGS